MSDKIEVQNVNTPGRTTRVDAAKYTAMREALLKGMKDAQAEQPITVKRLREALDTYLDQALFPGGATAGWWLKSVQLDLEAKGILIRAKGSPVRLSQTG